LKESTHVTTALRIKVLERPIIIHALGDTKNRAVLKPTEKWEDAIQDSRIFGWIVLPNHENRGLPLEQWITLWDDLRVEVEAQNMDGTWSDLFN